MEKQNIDFETLEYLIGYQEHLCEKYQIGYPSYLKKVKTPKHAEKEAERVRKKIDKLAKCSRHGGEMGQDCFICKLEAKF
jgi:hypothetical protein